MPTSKAAELALADPFIRRMPEGHDSVYRRRGNLSPRAAPLICIARAVADPAILARRGHIGVDTRTELQIRRPSSADARPHRFRHRAPAVPFKAPTRCRHRHGRIVECGTHGGLLARDGLRPATKASSPRCARGRWYWSQCSDIRGVQHHGEHDSAASARAEQASRGFWSNSRYTHRI